jgi:hypothetical protein
MDEQTIQAVHLLLPRKKLCIAGKRVRSAYFVRFFAGVLGQLYHNLQQQLVTVQTSNQNVQHTRRSFAEME